MITYDGKKMTVNQMAKMLVFERGFFGVDYWDEMEPDTFKLMTDREVASVNRAIGKQIDRVNIFLKIHDLPSYQDEEDDQ